MLKLNADQHSSVLYASEIQKGLLPKSRHFKKLGMDYGIIWEPHSILSGDFYWLGKKDAYFYIAVADCTGHGISASLLTVMGISLLNYIILGKNFEQIGDYLKELDRKWIETFQSECENNMFNNDWMEIILVRIHSETYRVEFSGAILSAIIKKHTGELITTGFNNYPIGGWQIEKNRNYYSDVYQLEKGDEIFLFTDGIVDQFGGEKNKKFGIKNLKRIIAEDFVSMNDKIDYMKEVIQAWKGNNLPTDDITVLGLKIR